MIIRVNKRCIKLLFVALIYRFICGLIFKNVLSVKFAYQQFINRFSYGQSILSWLVFLFLFFLLFGDYGANGIRLSFLVCSLLFFLNAIPFTVLMEYGMGSISYDLCNTLYWVAFIFGIRIINNIPSRGYKKLLFSGMEIGEATVNLFALFAAVIILYISGKYSHFRINLGLSDVYSIRSEARGYGVPTILYYLFCWTRTLVPIFYSYSLLKRRRVLSVIFLFLQLLIFSYDGMKSALFMIPVATFIMLFNAKKKHEAVFSLCVVFPLIAVLSLSESAMMISDFVTIYLVYRTIFIPAQIGLNYFDYFTSHEPDFFRSSFLRYLGFQSPYSNVGIIHLISGVYSGNYESTANTGLLADAITNLGIPGVIIMPLLVCVFLRFMDKCSEGLDISLVSVVAVSVSLLLLNAFLLVTITTNGLLILGIVMIYMKRTERTKYKIDNALCECSVEEFN